MLESKKTKLWKKFLQDEAKDYEKEIGVSIKTIKAIGHKKFIKANDWRKPEDVCKWRTDILHVIPCPHCGKDFGLFDDGMGLCDRCLKLFDLNAFYNDLERVLTSGKYNLLVSDAMSLFIVDKSLRASYLKVNRTNEIEK